jgi:hypothetical protein
VQDRRQALRQGTRPGARRITAQQARQGRFAAAQRVAGRRIDPPRRWLSPRLAWRRGFYAHYVPWFGPVFWPYAYTDLFFFSFWPYAYDDLYWAYAYDDFFDGIFFPYGAPYVTYAHAGPYDRVTTARRSRGRSTSALASVPGQVSESVQRLCGEPGSGVTAWPIESIEKAVKPTDEQHALLADLKRVSEEAADRFKTACPDYVPLTPTGRLAAMTERLQATLDAVKLVRPPLEKFYTSLDNEQQARFNAIGPSIGKKRQAKPDDAKAECSGDKAGLTAMPIERIEETVDPTGEQSERLGKLRGAVEKAVQTLEQACPDYIPQTPVGRLDVMQKRLEAMIEAANTMRPALEEFYGSLDNEQKARLNQLGRSSARTGG